MKGRTAVGGPDDPAPGSWRVGTTARGGGALGAPARCRWKSERTPLPEDAARGRAGAGLRRSRGCRKPSPHHSPADPAALGASEVAGVTGSRGGGCRVACAQRLVSSGSWGRWFASRSRRVLCVTCERVAVSSLGTRVVGKSSPSTRVPLCILDADTSAPHLLFLTRTEDEPRSGKWAFDVSDVSIFFLW